MYYSCHVFLAAGVEKQAGRLREPRSKAGGAAASFPSAAGGRSSALTSSKTHEHHRGHGVKAEVTLKTDRRQRGSAVGSPRPGGKTGRPRSGGTRAAGKEGLAGPSANGDAGPKESAACLTNQQLQKILHSVQTCSGVNQTDSKETGSSTNGGGRGGGGGGEMKEDDRGGGTDTSGGSRNEDHRASGCAFGWLEERRPDSRAAGDAKKAQWRRDLDEQVALKQQCSAPGRLQVRQEATPVEEVLSVGRREAQRRRWLEELDQQREEESERRRREKLLQSQTEDHDLWATHFDSMLRPRGPALSTGAERGGWEPTSSLSLVWEAESVGGASVGGASVGGASVGGASVGGASVDTTSGYPARASHLRTMTALLDPAQVEERERRRLKQLEQQRAIEAQVEERQLQRRREEARRREELEEEERKVALERETLERRYKLDTLRERQKVRTQGEDGRLRAEPLTVTDDGRRQEAQETSGEQSV
ncbi:Coiled-coil domain-containing protein 66 [Liparis tanakae]|uniref:Coiled-coil domain-containing protein 66 n=1 Tax=Liparis tanakae TaxID=230148 RepID=A0A4Z2FV82_9TELE|nr:Coiled-coil domain-containing protein 66 [Liparis tanakae]